MSYSPPTSAKPFTLNISENDFSEFKQLLKLSKIGPVTWEGVQDDRRFGLTHKWITETKDYWLNKYDWRAQEKHINSFPNYTMEIEGIDVHFIGMFSEKKDATPIVFMHGWPGSFIEFLPMAGLIREKYSPADQPYHVIIASLPGYTLSAGLPTDKDWKMEDTARVVDKLMKNLDFDKYIAQGGDVGAFVATILNAGYDACVATHHNFLRAPIPDASELTTLEQNSVERAMKWHATGRAYGQEHGSRPSTIGLVLSSNPLALLAWIGEKFLEWTDEDPPLDAILTNISLYWFTQGFPRSIYPYRQLFDPNRPEPPFLSKPTGYSFFQYELLPGIKKGLEKACNLVTYKQHERGGHFAALERPKELLEDVEEFVGIVWKKTSGTLDSRL
ncbi:epoxide hydrolase-like protein [Polyplosphaeria fusca]|uniref:Epoxide hydrolase-like protein n=1 Tax=Polyplosphaeria fusca TaxID=682080 RepID=A0A9P4R5F2_9PLEO|nr:epoxide hydrolase-like protein [Polyplosphaeria fusca]